MKLTNLVDSPQATELVTVENGQAVTSSLQLAEIFNKKHFHVMRDIQEKVLPNVSDIFAQSNFGLSKYTDSTGRNLPMYYLTRDGFTMVAMGYTGPRAMEFKERYIEAFNAMERRLYNKQPLTNDEIVDRAAKKVADKLFPQMLKTITPTLSKDIIERIRSLPQGETLLQLPSAVEPPPVKPKRRYVTLYVIITYDEEHGVRIAKTTDYDEFIAALKRITAKRIQYWTHRIRTVTYDDTAPTKTAPLMLTASDRDTGDLSKYPQIMTVADVKTYLNIGQRQAYELIHTDGFPAFKVGRMFKIEKHKFKKWLDNMSCIQ